MGKSKYVNFFKLNHSLSSSLSINTLISNKRRFYLSNGQSWIELARSQLLIGDNLIVSLNTANLEILKNLERKRKNYLITDNITSSTEEEYFESFTKTTLVNTNIKAILQGYKVENVSDVETFKFKYIRILNQCQILNKILNPEGKVIGVSYLECGMFKIFLAREKLYLDHISESNLIKLTSFLPTLKEVSKNNFSFLQTNLNKSSYANEKINPSKQNFSIVLKFINPNPMIIDFKNGQSTWYRAKNNISSANVDFLQLEIFAGPYYEAIKTSSESYNVLTPIAADSYAYNVSRIRYILDSPDYQAYDQKFSNGESPKMIARKYRHDILSNILYVQIDGLKIEKIFVEANRVNKILTEKNYVVVNAKKYHDDPIYLGDYLDNYDIFKMFVV